jgi:phosphatidate cytidylyltransferase
MKKVIERLLIFFIGLPAVVGLVLLLPYYHNLIMNIVIIFMSGIGAVEFSAMLKEKKIHITKIESFLLGALAPIAITLNISFSLPMWIFYVLMMLGAGWVLMAGVFSRSTEMDTVINRVVGGFTVLVYPGFFMYWVIKMNLWENSYAILLFLFITFASDSAAWLFGTLFGKNNRGLIAASPNKSIAGFIGGLFGSVIIAAGAVFFFPSLFFAGSERTSLMLLAIIIGFLTGIAAMLGDLAESAIKRSCDFKDSGNLMLGRGGVLDSIDSIAVAAPVFYMLYHHFVIN